MPKYHCVLFVSLSCCLAVLLSVTCTGVEALAQDPDASRKTWQVPLAGNAYTGSYDVRLPVTRDGNLTLSANSNSGGQGRSIAAVTVYFYLGLPGQIEVEGVASAAAEPGVSLEIGTQKQPGRPVGKIPGKYSFGAFDIDKPGYVAAKLTIESGTVSISDLRVRSKQKGQTLKCVESNSGNMFYWGRRGPSVHLSYELPRSRDIEYAYNEVTVPVGQDTLGSFFMANGFGQGYFGFQVNGKDERRVLFSVWSPYKTDNPAEIPEDQRVQVLLTGAKVRAQDFGNEGSGGQSFMRYDWKAGQTYGFLTRVQPVANDRTVYTSWFFDKSKGEWFLIASFSRPKTQAHLSRFHSFLENFMPSTGDQIRSARYHNTWVCDVDGKWSECVTARFSKDATGSGGHRLDFAGGVEGASFFLKNCGFFQPTADQQDSFRRKPSAAPPTVRFDGLPSWQE